MINEIETWKQAATKFAVLSELESAMREVRRLRKECERLGVELPTKLPKVQMRDPYFEIIGESNS